MLYRNVNTISAPALKTNSESWNVVVTETWAIGTGTNDLTTAGLNTFPGISVGVGLPFSLANAFTGTGSNAGAFAITQTDLLTPLSNGTGGFRRPLSATPVQVLNGVIDSTIAWTSLYGAGVGTGTWNEVGVFNNATVGTMLLRKVQALGTKAAGDVWTLTITTTFSSTSTT